MRSKAEIEAAIRPITDDEVGFYQKNGWVKLDHLVEPDLAAAMATVANERLQVLREAQGTEPDEGHEKWLKYLTGFARDGLEPFHSLMFSETMAQNAQRLADRRRLTDTEIALRYRADMIAPKLPGGERTPYHQDSAEHGSDRIGEMQWWLALAEVTPEMGAMRFLSGVHREGPLGSCFNEDTGDVLEQYPKLTDLYPLSPPLHYQPGDATVHHGYMLHGAPPNETDAVRLAYLFSYVPADTRWWNANTGNSGSERVLLKDEKYPIVAKRQEVAV